MVSTRPPTAVPDGADRDTATPRWRVAADIGGTFTDVAAVDTATGELLTGKALSSQQDLADGVLDAVRTTGAELAETDLFVHGSTVVINALLERRGAHTALVTTKGMRDVYEIGRINRPDSFNLQFRKHRPLIPRAQIIEVAERVGPDGDVLVPLERGELDRVVDALVDMEVTAIGIMLLHSYAFPEHERRLRDALAEKLPDAFITMSHELSREYYEYERTSTTVGNAYVGPRVRGYLGSLAARLKSSGLAAELLLMQSAGGLYDIDSARRNCIQLVESGPAGGVVGASALASALGIPQAIAFDVGGTTAKASVITESEVDLVSEYFVGGYNEGLVLRMPVVDIKEIGTGGGSIAHLDDAGGLHVGPVSAGSSPGPACYGLGGTDPTITDAHVVLGRMAGDTLLAGKFGLDVAAAKKAIDARIAGPLALSIEHAAAGILAIANAATANAVRSVTLERGLDPRDFVLIGYGGAGPLHAAFVAEELSIRSVCIPPSPGHFSAWGMLMADLRRDYSRTEFLPHEDCTWDQLEAIYEEIEDPGVAWFRDRGTASEHVARIRSVDMRYRGQEHTVRVPIDDEAVQLSIDVLKKRFDELHDRVYGHHAPEEPAELVTFRSSLVQFLEKPPFAEESGTPRDSHTRDVIFDLATGPVPSGVHWRPALAVDTIVEGPAVIEEPGSCTVIPPEWTCRRGEHGELWLTREEER